MEMRKTPTTTLLAISFLLLAGVAHAGVIELIGPSGDGEGNLLDDPGAVALDPDLNAYVAGRGSWNLLRVTPSGFNVTEILDTTHLAAAPSDVATDSSGNVYVAAGTSVFKIDTPGSCTTTAGDCVVTEIIDAGDGLAGARELEVDGAGNVFVASFDSDQVFRIASGGAISAIIDNAGDGGGNALDGPHGLDLSQGGLFVGGRQSDNVFFIATPETCPAGGCTITQVASAADGLEEPAGIEYAGIMARTLVAGKASNNVLAVQSTAGSAQLLKDGNDDPIVVIAPEHVAYSGVSTSLHANYASAFVLSDQNGAIFNASVLSETLGSGNQLGFTGAGGAALGRMDNIYVSDPAADRLLVLVEQSSSDLAFADDGDYVQAWMQTASAGSDDDTFSIQARRFSSDGTPQGPPFQVNTTTAEDQSIPKVAVNQADDSFVIVWASRWDGARLRRFDAGGNPDGDDEAVGTGFGSEPDLAMRGSGDFVVAWESGDNIKARLFHSDASPATDEFQVNTYDYEWQYGAKVHMAADSGDFVVAWESYYDPDGSYNATLGQRYSSGGDPVGDEFKITASVGMDEHDVVNPDVAVAPDGASFLVVWERGGNIEGHRYSMADASKIGNLLDIDTASSGNADPAVAVDDGDGSMMVVWESSNGVGSDASGTSIQGQRLDAAGVKVGDELELNQETARSQRDPAVALEDGAHLVTWQTGADNGSPIWPYILRFTELRDVHFAPPVSAGGSGSIAGRAWDDQDGDGLEEGGEGGLEAVAVRLLDGGGSELAASATDASGAYAFQGLDAGDYVVEFTVPAGKALSWPDLGGDETVDSDASPADGRTATISLGEGEVRSNVDAGLRPATLDNDGVDSSVEDNAPNNGDGNNDGIPDSEQAGVTSLPPAAGVYFPAGYITVDSSCPQQDVSTSNPPSDGGYLMLLGTVGFTLAPCSQAEVTVYFHGLANPAFLTYRKHDGSAWSFLPPQSNLVIGTAQIGGSQVVTATFTLFDGGAGDADGTVDDSIDDPGGVALISGPPSLSVPALTHAVEGERVDVPVSLFTAAQSFGSTAFSIDYDQSCLDADADDDGAVDQVELVAAQVPGDFSLFELFEEQDTDGEIDLSIADLSPPIAALGEGELLSIGFDTSSCAVAPQSPVDVAVGFSTDPSASLGDLLGQDVLATQTGGTVRIWPGPRGDCNSSDSLGAADLIAVALEIFDADGTAWFDAPGSSFAGSPAGCDANASGVIAAGDVSCANRLLFGLDCEGSSGQLLPTGTPELWVGQRLEQDLVWIEVELASSGAAIGSFVLSLDLDPALLPFAGIDADGDGRPDHLQLPGADLEIIQFDAADADGELDILIAELQGSIGDGLVLSVGVPASAVAPIGGLRISAAPAPSFGSTDGTDVAGHAFIVDTVVFRDGFESGGTSRWSSATP